MKSLEIVNNRLYWLKKNKATGLLIEEPELEKIKQDLEVLEIIKKKRVNVEFLLQCKDLANVVANWLSIYNSALMNTEHKLNLEELLKLKQWLEVNE